MLQREKEKADKKIIETKSKAEEIIKRKNENDRAYEQKLKNHHKQKVKQLNDIKHKKEAKAARQEAIERRKFEVYNAK